MQKQNKFNLVFIAVFCVLATVLYLVIFQADWSQAPATEAPAGIKPAKPGERPAAPDFALPDLSGRSIRLSDYRGKIVLLNFWATWCAPCRAEMPALAGLFRSMKGTDFALLTVAVQSGGRAEIEGFYRQLGLSLPTLVDIEDKTFRAYGLTGVPETFLVDRAGRVVQHFIGPRDWNASEFRQELGRLLAAPAR